VLPTKRAKLAQLHDDVVGFRKVLEGLVEKWEIPAPQMQIPLKGKGIAPPAYRQLSSAGRSSAPRLSDVKSITPMLGRPTGSHWRLA